jgi:ADP-ribose pyrophosphatase YjhB (NUDIX family)
VPAHLQEGLGPPGGVVEVGESPQLAAVREAEEELGLDRSPGRLLLTDWLPPWGGWDDAICLVFDGGEMPVDVLDRIVREEREIRAVAWCTPEEVAERAADFTARRISAALTAATDGPGRRTPSRGAEPHAGTSTGDDARADRRAQRDQYPEQHDRTAGRLGGVGPVAERDPGRHHGDRRDQQHPRHDQDAGLRASSC